MTPEIKRRFEQAAMGRYERRFILACDALLKHHRPDWQATGKTYSQAWREFVPVDDRAFVDDLSTRYGVFKG